MNPHAFHPLHRLLHWLMAILIIAMLFIGVSMVADLSPRHPLLVELHKATGLALLLLVVVRIGVRLTLPHPPLPPGLAVPATLRRRRLAPAAVRFDAGHATAGLGHVVGRRLPAPLAATGHRPARPAAVCGAAPGPRLGRLPVVRHRGGAPGGRTDACPGTPRRRAAQHVARPVAPQRMMAGCPGRLDTRQAFSLLLPVELPWTAP